MYYVEHFMYYDNFREAWAGFPDLEQLNNSDDNLVNFCTNMGPLLSCTWPNKDG